MVDNNSENFIFKDNTPISKKDLLKKIENKYSKELYDFIELQLNEYIDYNFQAVINADSNIYIEDNSPFITICHFLEGDAKYLRINTQNHLYTFLYDQEKYDSEYDALNNLINVINTSTNKRTIVDLILIYYYMGYTCPLTEKTVLSSDVLRLTEFSSLKENNPKRTYKIVLNDTNKIIGKISFVLKNINNYTSQTNLIETEFDNPNFSFVGNVHYDINEEYQRNGYATEALRMLILQIEKYGEEYAKELFIATDVNNIAAQQVALINGGKVIYEGDIPQKELPLNIRDNNRKRIIKI